MGIWWNIKIMSKILDVQKSRHVWHETLSFPLGILCSLSMVTPDPETRFRTLLAAGIGDKLTRAIVKVWFFYTHVEEWSSVHK